MFAWSLPVPEAALDLPALSAPWYWVDRRMDSWPAEVGASASVYHVSTDLTPLGVYVRKMVLPVAFCSSWLEALRKDPLFAASEGSSAPTLPVRFENMVVLQTKRSLVPL